MLDGWTLISTRKQLLGFWCLIPIPAPNTHLRFEKILVDIKGPCVLLLGIKSNPVNTIITNNYSLETGWSLWGVKYTFPTENCRDLCNSMTMFGRMGISGGRILCPKL